MHWLQCCNFIIDSFRFIKKTFSNANYKDRRLLKAYDVSLKPNSQRGKVPPNPFFSSHICQVHIPEYNSIQFASSSPVVTLQISFKVGNKYPEMTSKPRPEICDVTPPVTS